MDPHIIATDVRAYFEAHANPQGAEGAGRFFKEPIRTYGLPAKDIQKLAAQYRRQFKAERDFAGALALADDMIRGGSLEEVSFAAALLGGFERQFDATTFAAINGWVDHLTNWAAVDGICGGLAGAYILRHGPPTDELLRWTQSPVRWRRRAAAVSLVQPARKGLYLADVFRVAERLMADDDDLVRKGVGWLLKEASRQHADEVVDFLLRWRDRTSRLVLRYACELMPAATRQRVLAGT